MNELRILIIRIDRIGDVVLTTAMPREIKKKYSKAFIAVMIRSYTKDIYLNNPYVDEIIIADDFLNSSNSEILEKAKLLRKYNFTHSFLILPNEKLNYILFFSGIKYRYGTGYKFYQFITGVKGLSRNKYIPLRHEADYCMDFVRALDIDTDNLSSEIFLTENEKEKSGINKIKLIGSDKRKKIIGIHLTNGNSAPNWKIENYLKLIDILKKNDDYIICITDNIIPKELEANKELIFINRNQSLRESIINISMLDLLISSSTGPLHLAAALKVKTVSLFCPMTACSPKLWKPVGNISIELLPEENYCKTNCPLDPKKCYYKNDGIPISKVLNAINNILAN